jgi:hypothetical protein
MYKMMNSKHCITWNLKNLEVIYKLEGFEKIQKKIGSMEVLNFKIKSLPNHNGYLPQTFSGLSIHIAYYNSCLYSSEFPSLILSIMAPGMKLIHAGFAFEAWSIHNVTHPVKMVSHTECTFFVVVHILWLTASHSEYRLGWESDLSKLHSIMNP